MGEYLDIANSTLLCTLFLKPLDTKAKNLLNKGGFVIVAIAIGVSSLVTMAVLVLGLVIGSAMLPVLQSPVLAPAFANLMPAILGALAVPIFMRDIKTVSVPLAVGAVLLLIIGRPTYSRISSFLIPVLIVIAVAWSYFLYKRNTKNREQSA